MNESSIPEVGEASTTRAASAIKKAIVDIHEVQREVEETKEFRLLEQLATRWKERTAAQLTRDVSKAEAEKFRQMPLAPGYDETLLDSIAHHVDFLVALGVEIAEYPDQFRASSADQPPDPSAMRPITPVLAEATRLPYPERITAKWVWENASHTLWKQLLSLLLGAFLIGMGVGGIPAVADQLRRIFRWL